MSASPSKPFRLLHFSADHWEHVCPVLRVSAPYQAAGWEVKRGNEWVNGALQLHLEDLHQADLVVIQRDFPIYADAYGQVMAAARAQAKPVVYEIDDLLIELPENHPDAGRYNAVRAPVLAAIVRAGAVTCTTPNLCAELRKYNPNVWVLPNYLDDRLWTLRSSQPAERPGQPVLIGYLGAPSHGPDLEMILPVLENLLERYGERIRLRLWGIAPPSGLRERPNVEWLDLGLVSYAQFAAYFSRQECDLWVAPLQDNLFNRCKSALKFLEYSALGVPGVYSRLDPYERVVRHGENGYLATNLEEWQSCLEELIEKPGLRLELGQAAQWTVREGWLLSDHGAEWEAAYLEIARTAATGSPREREKQAAEKFRQWHADSQAEVQALHHRILEQEKDLQALVALSENYKGELLEMKGSTGWKLVDRLYRFRLALAPRGSARETLLRAGLHSLRVLRNEGAGALFKRWGSAVKHRSLEPVLAGSIPQPALPEVRQGARLEFPAISVVIERNPLLLEVDETAVLRWVETQSITAAEVIAWDRPGGRAWNLASPELAWEAPDLPALCQGLKSRYLCMASQDLRGQNSTYLEENLLALEGEGLIFTANQLGQSGWTTRLLHRGRLPGNRLQPLLRMVARKEYVRDDYSLDLEDHVRRTGGLPSTVGKVLAHTTAQPELGESFPVETPFGEVEARTEGVSIQVRSRSDLPWNSPARLLRSLDSVLPADPRPADLPTVAVVMPFLAVGGAEQHALKIMQELKAQIRFIVISFEAMDPALGTTSDAFRTITPYVYNLRDSVDASLNLSFMNYIDERFHLDTLYICNGTPWIYEALSEIKKRRPDIRIVNQVYDDQVGWINRYDPSLVLYLDGHIGVNSKICQAYIEKGAQPENVFLIENGVEPQELDPADYPEKRIAQLKEVLGLPTGKRVITFASRIHPQKRPLDFVELARRLSSDPSLVFLMVGDGPLAEEVETQVAKLGLHNFYRQRFYRPISDILALTDVLVLPSDFEGMPMIIIEAQTMGKPVVVTDVGNNREVLDRTNGGVLVQQIGDVAALMNGVQAIVASPPDPESLRRISIENFSIQVVARKYRDALVRSQHA